MEPITFLIVLAIIYSVALFFDLFFKSCMHYPYDAFLRNTGLTVQFMRIKWYTTSLNRTIFKWGSSCNRLFVQSFNFGVIVTFLILPLSIILIILTLFQSNQTNKSNLQDMKMITPQIEVLLPGINLPLDEILFYISALGICTICHELGHALAAVIEDVPITGFGVQIFFCFPLAYTEMSSEHLNSLKLFRKMRVLCAGIWHNIILGIFCYLIFLSLNIFFSPIYQMNTSVIITSITKNSPLKGDKGLYVNDILTNINNCKINDMETWYDCLLYTSRNKPAYCVSSDFIRLNDESRPVVNSYDNIIQCCDPSNMKLSCFEYIDDINNDDPIEIPQHVCLDIRKTIEDSNSFCTQSCDDGFCIKPLLNNSTTILTIKRKEMNDVIYIGHTSDVYRTIKVSEYVPKTRFFNSNFADSIVLFLKYNTVFSFGLAIINAIPCFGMDGHHIASTIINSFLVSRIPERGRRELIVLLVTCFGTMLFLCSVIKVLWLSLLSKLF